MLRIASLVLATIITLTLIVGCVADVEPREEQSGISSEALMNPPSYAGSLEWVFCDVKRTLSFESPQHHLEARYHDDVLRGFKKLGCNAIRVYISPDEKDPKAYPERYKRFLRAARAKGFRIYANPLGTGMFGFEDEGDDEPYASWIARYANEYQPYFLGPFNESGPLGSARMRHILELLRSRLEYKAVLVGPDDQHVDGVTSRLQESAALLRQVDVVGAHNAVQDASATRTGWDALARVAGGKAVWATENPRLWSDTEQGGEVGIKAVVASKARGVVLYLAYPDAVKADGTLTEKGEAIARGIRRDR
jgi:hypothetical protein